MALKRHPWPDVVDLDSIGRSAVAAPMAVAVEGNAALFAP